MYDENVSPQSMNSHLHHHHHHNNNNNNNNTNNNNNHGLHPPSSLEGPNYVELTGKGDSCIERTSLNCSSAGVNSVSGNSNNDSGVSNDYNLQLKSEPIGGPGSPDSLAELGGSVEDCAGCGQLIQVSGHGDYLNLCPYRC